MYYPKNKNSADENYGRLEVEKCLAYEKFRENETPEIERIMDELERHMMKEDERMKESNPFIKENKHGNIENYVGAGNVWIGLIKAMSAVKGVYWTTIRDKYT